MSSDELDSEYSVVALGGLASQSSYSFWAANRSGRTVQDAEHPSDFQATWPGCPGASPAMNVILERYFIHHPSSWNEVFFKQIWQIGISVLTCSYLLVIFDTMNCCIPMHRLNGIIVMASSFFRTERVVFETCACRKRTVLVKCMSFLQVFDLNMRWFPKSLKIQISMFSVNPTTYNLIYVT